MTCEGKRRGEGTSLHLYKSNPVEETRGSGWHVVDVVVLPAAAPEGSSISRVSSYRRTVSNSKETPPLDLAEEEMDFIRVSQYC
jgi:hypothetical protein